MKCYKRLIFLLESLYWSDRLHQLIQELFFSWRISVARAVNQSSYNDSYLFIGRPVNAPRLDLSVDWQKSRGLTKIGPRQVQENGLHISEIINFTTFIFTQKNCPTSTVYISLIWHIRANIYTTCYYYEKN